MNFFPLALAPIIPYFRSQGYFHEDALLNLCDNSSWYQLPAKHQ